MGPPKQPEDNARPRKPEDKVRPRKHEDKVRPKREKRSYHPDDKNVPCDSPPTKPIHQPSWARRPHHDHHKHVNKRRPLHQENVPLASNIPFTDETMGNIGDIHGTTEENLSVEDTTSPAVTKEELEMALTSFIESPSTKAVGELVGSLVSGTFEVARMSIDHLIEHKDEYIAVAKDSFYHLVEHRDEYIGSVKEGIQSLLHKSNDCAVEDEARWIETPSAYDGSVPSLLKSKDIRSYSEDSKSPWLDPLMPAEVRERHKRRRKESYTEYYTSPFADLSEPFRNLEKEKVPKDVENRKPILRANPLIIAVRTKQGSTPLLMRSPTPEETQKAGAGKDPGSRNCPNLVQRKVMDSVTEILKNGGKTVVEESGGDDDLDHIFKIDDNNENDGFGFDDDGENNDDEDSDEDDENDDEDVKDCDNGRPYWMDEVLRNVDEENEGLSKWLVSRKL